MREPVEDITKIGTYAIIIMQERKEKLSKDLISTEETFINKLTKEEILNLFE